MRVMEWLSLQPSRNSRNELGKSRSLTFQADLEAYKPIFFFKRTTIVFRLKSALRYSPSKSCWTIRLNKPESGREYLSLRLKNLIYHLHMYEWEYFYTILKQSQERRAVPRTSQGLNQLQRVKFGPIESKALSGPLLANKQRRKHYSTSLTQETRTQPRYYFQNGLKVTWLHELITLDLLLLNTGMGRTGSTVPAVHTCPRKFRTCNRLEVHLLWPRTGLGPPVLSMEKSSSPWFGMGR